MMRKFKTSSSFINSKFHYKMKLHRLILLMFGMFCFFNSAYCATITLPDIKYPSHPRILLNNGMEKQLLENISKDSIWNIIQQRTIKASDEIISLVPLKRMDIGKRMLGTSREVLYRIFMLSYAYRTTGDIKYAKRAETELQTVCKYKDWNPTHFLDLAEMAMGVAIGYDWLYPVLDKSTKKLVKKAIIEKGLYPSLDSKYNNFLNRNTNWNQVCNTAMAYCAIAIIEDQPELSKKIITRSIESIRKPMFEYESEGAYPEGYGYWQYGTTYNVMLLALLEQTYGTDFGLSNMTGFMRSPYYIKHMVGPTLLPFNFGDSGKGTRLNTSMFWFAQKNKDLTLLDYEIYNLLNIEKYDYEQYRRMLPSIFIFGNGIKLSNTKDTNIPLMFVAHNEAPVCLMRTSWNSKDAIYVGIKGGTPSDNTHTHLDAGSFVMDALGIRWAIDLGPQDYDSLERCGLSIWDNAQNSDRWKVYRYTNLTHNVFSINDELFNVKGNGKIKSHSDNPKLMRVTLDLTTLYNGLSVAERNISIINKKFVTIKDSICVAEKQVEITWRMLTEAKAKIIGGNLLLQQDGKNLFISIPHGSTPFISKVTPPNDFDEAIPGVYTVGYKITLPAHSKRSLSTQLIPESKQQIIEICNRVADWQINNQSQVKHHDLDWTNGAWYKGLVEWAKETNNEKYFSFLKSQGEKNSWNVYYRPYHADDICVSQMYIELAKKYKNIEILKRTIERLDSVVRLPSKAPLQKIHSKGGVERWSWSDALFMAPPVYAGLYTLTGKKAYISFMHKEFKECTDSLYDKNAKLYYRDCSKKPLLEPNGQKQFWARGNGWVFAAIPILLDILPQEDIHRDYYINIFKEMAKSILETQDNKGSWHASLLDPISYPLPENSASGFFCYGLAWGIRNGLLDKETYLEPMLKAWSTLCSYVDSNGKLGYIQPVGNAPKPADENSTDVYGVGAFLLAGTEILKLDMK